MRCQQGMYVTDTESILMNVCHLNNIVFEIEGATSINWYAYNVTISFKKTQYRTQFQINSIVHVGVPDSRAGFVTQIPKVAL